MSERPRLPLADEFDVVLEGYNILDRELKKAKERIAELESDLAAADETLRLIADKALMALGESRQRPASEEEA